LIYGGWVSKSKFNEVRYAFPEDGVQSIKFQIALSKFFFKALALKNAAFWLAVVILEATASIS
jgi:hypothetical protein